jgi:hypothetical protein
MCPPDAELGLTGGATAYANGLGIYTVVVTNTTSGCSSIGQIIVADCVTGIAENKGALYDLSVYPNPGNGLFTITGAGIKKGTELLLYNALGELIITTQIQDQATIDLRHQKDGMYFLSITDNGHLVYSAKLVKN